jgi:very-short-patch-repair endonuclease
MITKEFRQLVLDKLFKNGKMNHYCLKFSWFEDYGLVDLYNQIITNTDFLDIYNPSLRERIFYIENLYSAAQLCKYCDSNKLGYNPFKKKLHIRCNSKECRSKHSHITSTILNANLTDKQRRIKSEKISIGNSGTLESRFGKARADELKEDNRIRNIGRKLSAETINKMIHTRTGHLVSGETRKKISDANKIIHNSKEFRDKYKETYDNSRIKQSETMKRKIASGEFTPPVHNSWTHWDIKIKDGNSIKKFRSGWEGSFWVLNKHTNYEKLRIQYEYKNTIKNYIVDFIDQENKVVYEIKPDSLKTNEINKAKEDALIKWCLENKYTYIPINNGWFHENAKNIDYIQYPCLHKSMKQFLKI